MQSFQVAKLLHWTRTCAQRVSSLRPTTPAAKRHFTRPTFAPRPVLDIKSIAKSPGLHEQNCIDRNYEEQAQNAWKIHTLEEQRVALQEKARGHRVEHNKLQKLIGELVAIDAKELKRLRELHGSIVEHDHNGASSKNVKEAVERAKAQKATLTQWTDEQNRIEDEILELALALPNLSSHSTPNGGDYELVEIVEPQDERLKYHTTTPSECLNSASVSHVDIGAELDLLDFAGAANSSGWGWYYLKNEAAMLEQALVQYALSVLRRRGFTIVSPPSVVYSHIAAACGFQPRDQNGEQQIYTLHQPEKDANKPPRSLAATAEIPLAGMYAGHEFTEKDLPLRMCAVSRCYRAEAGARGADTKGLYRVHEFTKVEMFAWTVPPATQDEGYFATDADAPQVDIFSEMLGIQKEILEALGLTFRVLEMPASDLGGPASRKRDIEAFFPSRVEKRGAEEVAPSDIDKDQGWGEVTSTSMCTDYQSRRLGARVKRESGGKLLWPHTFNGTALAVPRVLAAIMETHFDAQRRSIIIPQVLRKWMDMDEIKR